ncbi:sensor histidine kinase [Cysteiniphilum halobium]|uniref:sensor histidine kinase n=1 Tax=Cysteiniphilum halobium TaxID=2219059 RepID=UPI003F83EDFF
MRTIMQTATKQYHRLLKKVLKPEYLVSFLTIIMLFRLSQHLTEQKDKVSTIDLTDYYYIYASITLAILSLFLIFVIAYYFYFKLTRFIRETRKVILGYSDYEKTLKHGYFFKQHLKLNQLVKDVLRRQKSDMLTMLHDLRTPYTRLSFKLELDYTDAYNAVKDDIKEIKIITGHSLAKLKENQLLTEKKEPIEIRGFIEQLFVDYKRMLTQDSKQLTLNLALNIDQKTYVMIKPFKLKRVLYNLLNNAIEYANTNIYLSADIVDKQVRIAIADDGLIQQNLDLKVMKQLFWHHSKNGHGIGLYSVAKILAEHQSELQFTTTDHCKSFYFELKPI